MKAKLAFLLIVITLSFMRLAAETDEWGGMFRDGLEEYRGTTMLEPENKQIIMHNWSHKKDELITAYKEFIEKHSGKKLTRGDYPDEILEILTYYYDDSDPEIEKVVDFFALVCEHDKIEHNRIEAINTLTTIAFKGNHKAREYIFSQKDNTSLPHRLHLQFHLANITLREDKQSLMYLMNLIKQAQQVETTDLKFNSPDEGVIVWYLIRKFFPTRYYNHKEYSYAIPLVKDMIFSKSKNVQKFAISSYYKHANRDEMRRIYEECIAKVEDKTTPREEFLNALYGLQALYELRDIGKHKMEFKGISSYFVKLGGLVMIDGEWQWKTSDSEPRLSAKEKRYFQKRLRSK